jgi:hypothetical protein
MSSIIFKNIIDKINTSSNNINNYFENIDSYNTNIYDILQKLPKDNIIIYIFIVFCIYNFISRLKIRLNEILSFIVCLVIIYILSNKNYKEFINYTDIKKDQINFINKLIFNGKVWDYVKRSNIFIESLNLREKSYLYLNPAIVDFFYNIRLFSKYNISSYVNSIIHCNNIIRIDYETKLGLDSEYYNFEIALNERKKALNELNSLIYNLPSTIVSYNNFNDSIKILQSLLNKLINDMSILFKKLNKTKEIDISTKPDNFYEENYFISEDDTKTQNFISTYNMY